MKILLPLHPLSATLGPDWSAPLALMPLANGSVLGQMLESALKAGPAELVCLVPSSTLGAGIEEWAADIAPDLAIMPVVNPSSIALEAAWAARDAWTGSDVLLLPGDRVVDAELGHLRDERADVIALSTPEEAGSGSATGVFWFRDGAALARILGDIVSAGTRLSIGADRAILTGCERAGLHVGWREARLDLPLLDGGNPSAASLLDANARLLSFGRSSAEAIERSYSEEFTVIPPVYIHEDAIVESAIIASQTSIAAGATVRNAVLHRCLIASGALVENAVLENALIGQDATVKGESRSLILPDGHAHVG